jgi:hypothetical protein
MYRIGGAEQKEVTAQNTIEKKTAQNNTENQVCNENTRQTPTAQHRQTGRQRDRQTSTYTRTHTQTDTHTHMYTHMYTHTCTHTCTHTYTQTHTHTHTHTHTQSILTGRPYIIPRTMNTLYYMIIFNTISLCMLQRFLLERIQLTIQCNTKREKYHEGTYDKGTVVMVNGQTRKSKNDYFQHYLILSTLQRRFRHAERI